MAYAFTSSRKVVTQVRAIALAQIDSGLDKIAAGDGFEDSVHALRKTCKKVRALLRLVRPQFSGYAAENEAIRTIANGLSVARDAAVMVQTFNGLVELERDRLQDVSPSAIQSLRSKLVARERHLREQMGEEALLAPARQNLEALRNRVEGWKIDGKGFDVLESGLARTYAQFRKRLGEAESDPSALVVHDWRKAAKYHWYHIRLLNKRAPAILKPLSVSLDALGECLGDHHNLAVLSDWIATASVGDEQTGQSLLAAAGRHQAKLLERGFGLGHQLTVEKPAALAHRLRLYWSV